MKWYVVISKMKFTKKHDNNSERIIRILEPTVIREYTNMHTADRFIIAFVCRLLVYLNSLRIRYRTDITTSRCTLHRYTHTGDEVITKIRVMSSVYYRLCRYEEWFL